MMANLLLSAAFGLAIGVPMGLVFFAILSRKAK